MWARRVLNDAESAVNLSETGVFSSNSHRAIAG